MTEKPPLKFKFQWKEQLVGLLEGNEFIIEFTIGVETAYLPTESKWDATAPEWAKGQWQRVLKELEQLGEKEGWPVVVDEAAWVWFIGPPMAPWS